MNPDNVLDEVARAGQALRAATLLQEEGLFADSVSRSYYAVMHAARAALLAHDTIAESHSAVRRLFGEVLVRPGRIEKAWSTVLATEQTQRISADYEAGVSWDARTTLRLVQDAAAFLQRMRAYLAGLGIQVAE